MENIETTTLGAEETLVATPEVTPVQDKAMAEPITVPLTPQEQLTQLINRRTGEFEVRINHADLKFLKNTINQKVEWKGPNEAYLVIMSVLTMDNTLQAMDPKEATPVKIKLPASTIESINFFLTKIGGKGIDSAQRVFSVSMMFRQSMEAIRKIDEEINLLKSELQTEKTS